MIFLYRKNYESPMVSPRVNSGQVSHPRCPEFPLTFSETFGALHLNRYTSWPENSMQMVIEIVSFPIKMVIFHSYWKQEQESQEQESKFQSKFHIPSLIVNVFLIFCCLLLFSSRKKLKDCPAVDSWSSPKVAPCDVGIAIGFFIANQPDTL